MTEWERLYEAERPRAEEQVRRRMARLRAEREARTKCACSECPNPATETEHSPYMNDFCDDCTWHRCDIASHHVARTAEEIATALARARNADRP